MEVHITMPNSITVWPEKVLIGLNLVAAIDRLDNTDILISFFTHPEIQIIFQFNNAVSARIYVKYKNNVIARTQLIVLSKTSYCVSATGSTLSIKGIAGTSVPKFIEK